MYIYYTTDYVQKKNGEHFCVVYKVCGCMYGLHHLLMEIN